MKTVVVAIICIFYCFLAMANAVSYWDMEGKDPENAAADSSDCFQRLHDTTSEFWISTSNRMTFGAPFDGWDFIEPEEVLPRNLPYAFNASYPANRATEYLHGAGLWVGGIKGNDTLVSHAFDYAVPVPEFLPLDCTDSSFGVSEPTFSDFEITATATDTVPAVDSSFRCLVGDCNDWYPLSIQVNSRTYRWESPPYDNILFVFYTVTNSDSMALDEGWVGLFADCDIGTRENAHADDVSGYLDGAVNSSGDWIDIDVGYSIDVDGDPDGFAFGSDAHTGALAVQFLGMTGLDPQVHFNWWTNAAEAKDETAPRRSADARTDLGGSISIAYGDSNKYHLMSYPEKDYNQSEAGYVHYGWNDLGDAGTQAAMGGDTRFLVSAGPFTLQPGESVEFAFAIYIADGVVTNPFVASWLNPSSPQSVADFYETLDFSDLSAKAVLAQEVYDAAWMLPPPGPPSGFTLDTFDDSTAAFSWEEKPGQDIAGYVLKYSFDKINWMPASVVPETTTQIMGLLADSIYYFAAAAFDADSTAGKLSPIITLRVGAPQPPFAVTGTGRRGYPELSWEYDPGEGPLSFRIYRISPESADTVMLAEQTATEFVDYGVSVGVSYRYFLTAVSPGGIESPPSVAVRIVPMPLSGGILAVDYNTNALFSNLVYDRRFFKDLIDSSLYDMAYAYRPFDPNDTLTLDDLANYSLVIISAENRSGSLDAHLENILRLYLQNGGKVILILRHAGTGILSENEPVFQETPVNSLLRDYLFIDSAYFGATAVTSGMQLQGDLIGAASESASYPQLSWDSARVNEFSYVCADGIPYCGFIVPRDGVDILYRYISSTPASVTDGRVNAVMHTGEEYRAAVLNMPLSLMRADSASVLLRTLALDMGEGQLCGDINIDFRVNIGDVVAFIRYLYYDEEPPGIFINGDVNCDAGYAMDDLLILINFVLRHGLSPRCCP